MSATVAVLATLAVVTLANPPIHYDHFTLINNSGSTQYLHHCKGSCLDTSTVTPITTAVELWPPGPCRPEEWLLPNP